MFWGFLTTLDFVLGALGLCLMVEVYIKTRAALHEPPLPPGPPGKFILGNLLEMPRNHEWKKYAQWAKEFGNLFSLKVLHKRLILVNSVEIAHDLFDKRSSLYSDRPHLPMLNDLMGFDWNLGMMPYGERWRRHRKMFYKNSHPEAAEDYCDTQIKHTRILLPKLYREPDKLFAHFRHFAGAFILEIVYGIKVQDENDPYVQLAEKAVCGLITAAVPGTFLVDLFPIMKYIPEWFPGATFRTKARVWRKFVVGMCVEPFKAVKAALAAGGAQNSIAASLLEDLSRDPDAPEDEEEVIRNASAVAYLGGTDTSSTALAWFMLAMVIYPEVQRKAQAEIDSVVESDRLPEFDDRARLPYITALCKESLRWNPVAPLAIPHMVTADNIYAGFKIPKGSLALGNAWAILHDEKAYGANVEEFDPERFLKPGVPEPVWAFGFGRRTCPGRYVAENLMFIVIASILKVYSITPAKDHNGNPIPVSTHSTSGAVAGPLPFKYEIKSRSADAAKILAQLNDD